MCLRKAKCTLNTNIQHVDSFRINFRNDIYARSPAGCIASGDRALYRPTKSIPLAEGTPIISGITEVSIPVPVHAK